MLKPLLIGEAPSKNEHPPTPIAGRIGKRLAACAGMDFERFLEAFDRVNLLEVRQDTREKGFEFDLEQARKNARVILYTLVLDRPAVVLLGLRVALAFGVKHPYFEELTIGGVRTFVVPHPSGVNRWWNDPRNETRASLFMRWLVKEIGL